MNVLKQKHCLRFDWKKPTLSGLFNGRLMAYYPQLYTDLAVKLWVEPNTQRYIKDFLKNIKKAGYLSRVMYGSDQMVWPYATEKSIRFLNTLNFLTKNEKEDILYNNASRFLRLKR